MEIGIRYHSYDSCLALINSKEGQLMKKKKKKEFQGHLFGDLFH
jgi:hypothetical protein